LPLAAFRKLAAEMYRVLQPGARLRIVVPDGEVYLCAYCNGRTMPYAATCTPR
jgi:predicted SAM-dependent methyltransferase